MSPKTKFSPGDYYYTDYIINVENLERLRL